jgi:ABC-type nickel/cobalt efflux system permease component RcnA
MIAISFDFLFKPVEGMDAWLTDLFAGSSLLVALGVAFLLGLRHASDPDHLVAVTSLVASDDGDARRAARLGAWWGIGHAAVLVALGIPLIAFKSALPPALESGAEVAIGAVIVVLALRVILKWARGDYRAGRHSHEHSHSHLRDEAAHRHDQVRTPRQAFAIGVLHGLAGTGAVVVLLLSALPTRLEAALALAVFAPMTIVSMTACTTAFAWILTSRVVEPIYRSVLIPAMGLFGVMFGVWYIGLG